MSDDKSIYPRIETGYACTENLNDELVKKFNSQTFTKGRGILKIKYFCPKNLIFQHIPVKKRVRKMEIIRVRNGYLFQTLTSVDFQEIVKIGGIVFEVYEGIIYLENFKVSPFKQVIDKSLELRQKYIDKNGDDMQLLVKLNMNRLYDEQIRKDIEKCYECKSEACMMAQYDERVLYYQKIDY